MSCSLSPKTRANRGVTNAPQSLHAGIVQSPGRGRQDRICDRSVSVPSTILSVLMSFVRPYNFIGTDIFRPRRRAWRAANPASSAVFSAAASLSASMASPSGSTPPSAASERPCLAVSGATASCARGRVSGHDRDGTSTMCNLSAGERTRGATPSDCIKRRHFNRRIFCDQPGDGGLES